MLVVVVLVVVVLFELGVVLDGLVLFVAVFGLLCDLRFVGEVIGLGVVTGWVLGSHDGT